MKDLFRWTEDIGMFATDRPINDTENHAGTCAPQGSGASGRYTIRHGPSTTISLAFVLSLYVLQVRGAARSPVLRLRLITCWLT